MGLDRAVLPTVVHAAAVYDMTFPPPMSRKDTTTTLLKSICALTCSEECNRTQIGKLLLVNVELGQGLHVLVDLADAGSHLLHVDRLVVPRQSALLVADNEGEDRGDRDLPSNLCQTQNKQIPVVSRSCHKPHPVHSKDKHPRPHQCHPLHSQ